MSEHSTQGSDSDQDRTSWFANLAPRLSDLNLVDFQQGLNVSDEMFSSVQELIIQAYEKHGLHKLRALPASDGGPDYKSAVTEASAALLEIFESVPETWMSVWCETVILNLWQQSAANEHNLCKGKQPVLEDSPTTGEELPKFAKQLPGPTATGEYKQRAWSLDQMTFGLRIVTAPEQSQQSNCPVEILEIISTRCVPEGKDPRQVKNYRLPLFIDEFEEILNVGTGNRPFKLANGKLVYFHGGEGNDALRIITSQQQFEVAVSHLLNNADGDMLGFTFCAENCQQKRQGPENKKTVEKAAKIGELGKSKPENFRSREIAGVEGKKATKVGDTKNASSLRARTPPLPAKNPARKMVPKKASINESIGTKVKESSDPRRRRSLEERTKKTKGVSSSTPRRQPQDPVRSKTFMGRLTSSKTNEILGPVTTHAKENSSLKPAKQDSPPSLPGSGCVSEGSSSSTTTKWPRTGSATAPEISPVLGEPALRKRSALDRGVALIQNVARRTSSVVVKNPAETKAKNKVPTRSKPKNLTAYPSEYRRPSNFLPQPQSPALKTASTVSSRASKRGSISLPDGIKNILNVGGKDTAEKQSNSFEDFYAEVSRKTFRRGGESEQETSIETLQKSRPAIRDDEAEEQEEADDFESPDEYLVSRLQGLLEMEELKHISSSEQSEGWIECCRMFQINPFDTGVNETVALAGLNTSLYQYQAFSVYWQMKASRELGGGFVADEMGLGKSLSFLAYLVAERQLSWLWEDVKAARTEHTKRHLNEIDQHQGDRCPSRHERLNWIACPCAPSSPTSKFPAKPGIRLTCVPASLVKSWEEQWNTHIDEREVRLGMRIVVAHDPGNPIPNPGYTNRDARHTRNVKELSAVKHPFDSKLGKYYDDTARPHQDRYLVVTTRDSYKTWVKKFEYRCLVLSGTRAEIPSWVSGKNRGIVFGIAMIDECHEEYLKEKGRSGVLADLPVINSPFLWGYSGTPLVSSPRNLEGVLWAIEEHFPKQNEDFQGSGWEEDAVLCQFHYKALDLLCKDFEKHIRNGTGSPQVFTTLAADLKPFLTTFMIRRTADSTWFGRPLIKLKTHIHQDVVLAHNTKFDKKLAELQEVIAEEALMKLSELQNEWKVNDPNYKYCRLPNKLAFNTQCRVEWRLRVIATFPFLVNLAAAAHKHHLDLTTEEVVKFKGKEVCKSPYSLYLRQIVESSPKCIWLRRYIEELSETLDADGKEQKLVVMTQFNPVAFILKLFIERMIKDKKGRVGLICAGMKQRERTAVLDAFIDAVDKDSGTRKQKQNFQILVGTTRLIGTGLQLTRACNLVMMEPDYEFYRELQAVARVHRIGQKNTRSYSFRLIDQGSEIENRIVKRQEERGGIFGKEVKTRLLSDFVAQTEEVVGLSIEERVEPADGSDYPQLKGERKSLAADVVQELEDQLPTLSDRGFGAANP